MLSIPLLVGLMRLLAAGGALRKLLKASSLFAEPTALVLVDDGGPLMEVGEERPNKSELRADVSMRDDILGLLDDD